VLEIGERQLQILYIEYMKGGIPSELKKPSGRNIGPLKHQNLTASVRDFCVQSGHPPFQEVLHEFQI
jgi:hypothetical protein